MYSRKIRGLTDLFNSNLELFSNQELKHRFFFEHHFEITGRGRWGERTICQREGIAGHSECVVSRVVAAFTLCKAASYVDSALAWSQTKLEVQGRVRCVIRRYLKGLTTSWIAPI